MITKYVPEQSELAQTAADALGYVAQLASDIGSMVQGVEAGLESFKNGDIATASAAFAQALRNAANITTQINPDAGTAVGRVAAAVERASETVVKIAGIADSVRRGIANINDGNLVEAARDIASAVNQTIQLLHPTQAGTPAFMTAVSSALASLEVGRFIGQQIPQSEAVAALSGAAAGAAVGTVIMPGIGSAIGLIFGSLGGFFGSRDAAHRMKQLRHEADSATHVKDLHNLSRFWTATLSAVGYSNMDAWQNFVTHLASRIHNGAESYSFGSISVSMDQQDALVFVGSQLAMCEIRRNAPHITSFDQVPGFREAYVRYILENTFIERSAQVVHTENIDQKWSLVADAGMSINGHQPYWQQPQCG